MTEGLTADDGRALLEHMLAADPLAVLRVDCRVCGQTSQYNYQTVIKYVHPQRLPKPLPPEQHWAHLVLYGGCLEDRNDAEVFFGERILVETQVHEEGRWLGTLLRPTAFAPEVQPGEMLCGEVVVASGLWVAEYIYDPEEENGQEIPTVDSLPRIDFEYLIVPPGGDFWEDLQSANVYCANPSCPTVFSSTYSDLKKRLKDARGPSDPTMTVTCGRCGVTRVISAASFHDRYRL